ncbi:uncharacterized protein K460DRAFT_409130 [Cucurbitaria berberidis CBS 394.84]|uniref:Uncharacterized protein n=1 Tax=Cucurbitaria berberidis CBS 394.84 TaxID=1168544 RepID=A0A9P4L4U4_9PLEO|nr:uncharacterized protein K460DRAFT_409130 [Cucurbitaria berberidis CBS 394.84]KAF1841672.1 hypothetical protein K460DRAFT_409130 [Cucurbitaria berberidis CBS 394.84]
MEYRDTSPYSEPYTPGPTTPNFDATADNIATPVSINSGSFISAPYTHTFHIPTNLTQVAVDADQQLKRFQQDLLVLTCMNENESLHWRPSWFKKKPISEKFWTLHNPPNVVTERIPHKSGGRQYFTRRMREADDSPPFYIQSWDHWERHCARYGIPQDFLSEQQIELMRLGLPRDEGGKICAPPVHPLYPEPQPLGQGRYILDPSIYATHLPRKFQSVNYNASTTSEREVVVVHSDGTLKVEPLEKLFIHTSQWTHFDGYGGYQLDEPRAVDNTAPKTQGSGRRWSYLPWTREQSESCKPLRIDLRPLAKRLENDATGRT